jgi:large repetitive protein
MKRHPLMPVLALLAFVASACSLEETAPPPLAGPSEFALGIVVRAVPDSILQDGISQSFITIDAKGPDGRPARGVSLRLEMLADGVPVDFGRLSTKLTTTGDDGQARVTYTAPPKPAESVGSGIIITIMIEPVGNDYRGEFARQVDIRLIPPGVIVPPNAPPQAAFTFTPPTVAAFDTVAFDASTSLDEGVPCGSNCTYQWNFGDGGSASGRLVTHQFRATGTFVVQLTVTDARGRSGTAEQSITVGPAEPPSADFTFSPTDPRPSQSVFFNASASRAAAGRRIVSYRWDFGTGESASGVTVSKTFATAGTYNVTLNVTDDANQVGTASKSVPVTVPEPTTPLAPPTTSRKP